MRIATETSYHRPEKSWKEEMEAYDRGFDGIDWGKKGEVDEGKRFKSDD